jgi:phytoene dehydrogenase-like protein
MLGAAIILCLGLFLALIVCVAVAAATTPLASLHQDWKRKKNQPRNLLNRRWPGAPSRAYDVVIIGSGPSGLHCAAMLASAGRSVCVLEQHDVVGGASHQYVLAAKGSSYTFDSGLHYAIPLCEQMTQVCVGAAVAPVRWPKMGVNSQGTYELIVYDEDEAPFEIKHNEAHMDAMQAIVGSAAMENAAYAMKGWPLYILSRAFSYPYQGWLRWLFGNFKSFAGMTQREALKNVRDPKARALLQGLWLNTGSRPTKV